eukprot:10806353-Ditylum_brightwellii.AAC.1
MSAEAKAAIYWIILLQSRHFAAGHTDVLAEFDTMQACLAAENTNIKHAELPQALINVDKKRKWDEITPTPRM